MTQYRRNGLRRFYKIYDDGTVCAVLNQQNWSEIKFGINGFMIADIFDPYPTNTGMKEITGKEFNEAYKLAYDRISLQRIDV